MRLASPVVTTSLGPALLLRDLGVDITAAGSAVTVVGRGVDGLREPARVLDCGNSGTTMRTTRRAPRRPAVPQRAVR